ncbi:MAG: four helix bundle protein [Bryobacteraceae bacterium]
MTKEADALRARTMQFAIRVVKMFQALPKADVARTIGRQVLRSGTSVGANYRAVCRARSRAEFAAKLGLVIEEADETVFWLDLLTDTGIVRPSRMEALLKEANELLAIFAASQLTVKARPQSSMRKSSIVNPD